MRNHGYYAIDGDCVMQSVKHKLCIGKVEYNSAQMLNVIARELDVLSAFGRRKAGHKFGHEAYYRSNSM